MKAGEDTCPRDRDGFCGVALLALRKQCFGETGCALNLTRDERIALIKQDWDRRFNSAKRAVQAGQKEIAP